MLARLVLRPPWASAAALAAIAFVACATAPRPAVRAPAPPACARPIAGLDAHLAPGAMLWFGEMHGTNESPRFVGDVACHAAREGRVQLGLELPTTEQPAIDRYLASSGGPADRRALLAGAFWRQHDGRSSTAMAALIEHVRALRAAGAPIAIVAFDAEGADRDASMADFVARARDPRAIWIALSGNVHSRRTRGVPWDPAFVPTVAHLVERGLPVTSFDVAASGGTFWGCLGPDPEHTVCGEHPMHGEPGTPWTLGPPRDASHAGTYHVGTTTAAYPAVSLEIARPPG